MDGNILLARHAQNLKAKIERQEPISSESDFTN